MLKILVKEVRTKKNISIRNLSLLSDVSKSHIEKIEDGKTKPSLEVIYKIAKVLDVSIYDLFEEID